MSEAILNLHITDLSRGGAGVARDTSGRVIFVPYSLPGDEVRVQIIDAHKRFAQGLLLEVVKSSKDRVNPPCAVFGKCGGCQWQHVPYSLQWKTKVSGVQQALARVQVRLSEISEYPAQKVWEYRNRVQLRGQFVEDAQGGRTELGFFARGSHDLIAAERCEISRPEINQGWGETRRQAQSLDRSEPFKVEVEVLSAPFPGGPAELRRTWNSAHGAAGFRQVNDEQNEQLKGWIRSTFEPWNGSELYDLFGGAGNLSLQFQDSMSMIHCVDVSSPAQSPVGTPSHFRFYSSPASRWIVKQANQASKNAKATSEKTSRLAILDPPREGLSDSFEEIAVSLEKLGVDRLIAVGCDPDSWAKDVSRFQSRGWILRKTALFDFFPQTPHVESAGFLTLGDV